MFHVLFLGALRALLKMVWYFEITCQMYEFYIIHDNSREHYNDVVMGAIASQIASRTFVYSNVYSDADQSKHQSSASLAFVRGIHRGPGKSPHKWPVTRKIFPFDDVIMRCSCDLTCISHGRYHDCINLVHVEWAALSTERFSRMRWHSFFVHAFSTCNFLINTCQYWRKYTSI